MVDMCLHFLGNLTVNIAVLFVEVTNPVDARPDICLVIKQQHAKSVLLWAFVFNAGIVEQSF